MQSFGTDDGSAFLEYEGGLEQVSIAPKETWVDASSVRNEECGNSNDKQVIGTLTSRSWNARFSKLDQQSVSEDTKSGSSRAISKRIVTLTSCKASNPMA